ncbi:MAG: serine/threonine protein kinase [Lentisphaerae bacterium]|nr:serine/threonine protein kinase [Lentisphaerota bacterium]MCP4101664.1 serine/threonine protein kinase [Lentisphaerota bacterium]
MPEYGQTAKINNEESFDHLNCIGDYQIIKLLGAGGMGEVFLARQKALERNVALKVLLPGLTFNERSMKRFFREVRTLAKIEHPGIVRAYEAGAVDNVCYFSMEFVAGIDLHDYIYTKNGLFTEEKALAVISQLSQTLDYAWRKHRLIHRDIKPSNILLAADETASLLDLGISKLVAQQEEGDERITHEGMMVGSPQYVSPEQARDEKIDCRSDMYSLGITLFEMLCGRPPFDGENSIAIICHHLNSPVPDPRKYNPAITVDTYSLIKKMMAKKASKRYNDWHEVELAVQKILAKINPAVKKRVLLFCKLEKTEGWLG